MLALMLFYIPVLWFLKLLVVTFVSQNLQYIYSHGVFLEQVGMAVVINFVWTGIYLPERS